MLKRKEGEILLKEELAPQIKRLCVWAPHIAEAAKAGQFVILRVSEKGERIPLTIYKTQKDGTLSVIFKEIGKTTMELGTLGVGECVADIVGPLGNPVEIPKGVHVLGIAGGVGVAALLPKVHQVMEEGGKLTLIGGAKTAELVILEDEMKEISDEVYVCTDDGTVGYHGFVTELFRELLEKGRRWNIVLCVGPVLMMKAVTGIATSYGIKTLVSLNTIMVDGTGMCGSCRVSYKGEAKFVCVDGPIFEGEFVNFDELLFRERRFRKEEELALKRYERQKATNTKARSKGEDKEL